MDITGIRFSGGMTLTLPIFGAQPTDPYIIKAADGLGPPKTDVFVRKSKSGKSHATNIVARDRQLVFRIGLNPDYSSGQRPADLRSDLYRLISGLALPVTVSLMNGSTEKAKTRGYVSAFETVQFSREPMVQITIDCDGPYFEHPEPVVLTQENGGLTPGGNKIIIDNPGDAPSAFLLNIRMTQNVVFWTMKNYANNEVLGFVASGLFQNNDIVSLDTNPGSRRLMRTRSGTSSSLLNRLSGLDFSWVTLTGGENELGPDTSGASMVGQFEWASLTYTPKYQGV